MSAESVAAVAAEVFQRFREFIVGRHPHAKSDERIDLHSSSLAMLAAAGYCPDHGEVLGIDRPAEQRYQCWCGQTVILKTEARKIRERAKTPIARSPRRKARHTRPAPSLHP